MHVDDVGEIRYRSGYHAFSSVQKHAIHHLGKELPTVSIVTTVLNRAHVVERAVVSVLGQTYPAIEYIVIDGGSSDRTCEILAKYSDKIDYIESKSDSGIYAGMNRGIRRATGDFILLLNSDDWYVPTCVERLMKSVLEKRFDVVSALSYEVDECGKSARKLPRMELDYNVFLRMPLRHETMLISRAVYDTVGLFDETYKIIGDLKHTQKIFRRILDNTFRFNQLNDYVMCFRKLGAASSLTETFIRERKRLLEENFPKLSNAELDLLAGEYIGDPMPYIDLALSLKGEVQLKKAIERFLTMHGVFRTQKYASLSSLMWVD